jgi:hypothetical protein
MNSNKNVWKSILWIFVVTIFLSPLPLLSDGPWKVKKNSKGIMVETRTADGYEAEEFRATTTINTPFEKAVEIMKEVPKFVLWMPRLLEAKVVKEESPNSKIIYMAIDMPWPVKDRDMYVQMTEKLDLAKGVYERNNVGIDGYPIEPQRIRFKKVSFLWVLKRNEADKNKTDVLYTSKGDPAGKLPAWIINLGNVDIPHEFLFNLKYKYPKN